MRPTLFALPLVLAASAVALHPTPASAKAGERCATMPAQIRAAAAKAEPGAASAALRHLGVGEQLCQAGNERAAAKKFRAASQELGIGEPDKLAQR